MSDDGDIIGTATDKKTGVSSPIRRGRASGLTPEKHAQLVKAFKSESSIKTVAARCRVNYRTLQRWLHHGENGHPDYVDFALEVAEARNKHKSRWMENVERMAEGDSPHALRANLTLLARQFPDEWGDRDTVALDEHKSKKDESEFLKSLTADELRLLQAINEKRKLLGGGDDDD